MIEFGFSRELSTEKGDVSGHLFAFTLSREYSDLFPQLKLAFSIFLAYFFSSFTRLLLTAKSIIRSLSWGTPYSNELTSLSVYT